MRKNVAHAFGIVCLLLLSTAFLAAPAAARHQFLSWLPFDPSNPLNRLSFIQFSGANVPITIGWGSIELLDPTLVPGVCPDGIGDFINPVADVYIVPSSTIFRNSPNRLRLHDFNNAPNSVIQFDGNFFDATIGITGGGIPTGTYAVVYDECQDGYFDDNIDFLLDPAFEVTVNVPSLPSAGISALKERARMQAEQYAPAAAEMVGLATSLFVHQFGIDPRDATARVKSLVFFGEGVARAAPPLFQPVVRLPQSLLNIILYNLAIYADPPDAAFREVTSVSGRQVVEPMTSETLLVAIAAFENAVSSQSVLAEALLRALERYQGAEAAGDGDWALTQARAIQHYATLLAAQLTQGDEMLGTLSDALSNDTRALDTIASELEIARARIAAAGFSAEERQSLVLLGLTVEQIDTLAADMAEQHFAFSKANLVALLARIHDSNTTYITVLNALTVGMAGVIATLESDALVVDKTPRAHAGGPYNADEGVNVVFNASGSTSPSVITMYEWDLDGDGSFNDAMGPNPSFTYTRLFSGLVGVRVTNADQLTAVAYTSITIREVNRAPRITAFTPAGRSLDLKAGEAQTFTVTAADPEGDPLSIQWRVDGTLVATGLVFEYVVDPTSGGLHAIEAVVSDTNLLGGTASLSWIVAIPAPADSANLSMTMRGATSAEGDNSTLTYHITVINNGPAAATDVVLTDDLPLGFAFGTMTASQGSCTRVDDRTVTCALGDLGSGASATAMLTGTPTTTATITNTARVTATEFDPQPGANQVSQGIPVDYLWIRQFGDVSHPDSGSGAAVDETGVYVVGYLGSDNPYSNAFIRKYDPSGTALWTRRFTGVERDINLNGDIGSGVAVSADAVYVVGTLFQPHPSSFRFATDAFVRKYDKDGGEMWAKQLGTTITGGGSEAYGVAVHESGVYVVGFIQDSATVLRDGFLQKYDTAGNELWTRRMQGAAGRDDAVLGVTVDASDVYVVGCATGGLPGQPPPAGPFAVFIQKYNADGDEIWTRQFDTPCGIGSGLGLGAKPGGIAVDTSGIYIVGEGDGQAFVRKYDKEGNKLWSRQVSAAGADYTYAEGVATDGATVYVSGSFHSLASGYTAFVRRYNINGDEIGTYEFAGSPPPTVSFSDTAPAVAAGCAGVFVAGSTGGMLPGQVSAGGDAFVIKLSSSRIPCNPQGPTIAADSSLRIVNEGQSIAQTGTYTSVDTIADVTLTASRGQVNKTGTTSGTWTWSLATTDGPAQNQTVTITAEDGQGGIGVALFELVVTNVAPVVRITNAPASGAAGAPLQFDSIVTDRSPEDTSAGFTYAWNVQRSGTSVATGSGASLHFTPLLGGTYQITLHVTDKDGSTGSDTVSMQVVQTNHPPTAHAGPDQTVEATATAGASVTLSGLASSDLDGDALAFTWTGPFGTASGVTPTVLVPLGTHTITLTVDDGKGGTASATTTVAVVDTTPPTLTLPPPITAEATGPGGAAVSFTISALDLVDGVVPVSCVPPSGTLFAPGTTTVTCSTQDSRGLTAVGSFAVTVKDTTPPALTLPGNLTVPATGPQGATVQFSTSATDLVDGSRPVTCTPATGSTFAVGTTSVHCAASDTRGNSASGSFTVTVQGATPPELMARCLPPGQDPALSGGNGATVTLTEKVPTVTPLFNVRETFTVRDGTGNALVATFGVNTKVALATTFTIQRLTYNGGTPVKPAVNNLACLWTRDRAGKLTTLTQNVVLFDKEIDVLATYQASKHQTVIRVLRRGKPPTVSTRAGLVSLYLTTNQGVVGVEY